MESELLKRVDRALDTLSLTLDELKRCTLLGDGAWSVSGPVAKKAERDIRKGMRVFEALLAKLRRRAAASPVALPPYEKVLAKVQEAQHPGPYGPATAKQAYDAIQSMQGGECAARPRASSY